MGVAVEKQIVLGFDRRESDVVAACEAAIGGRRHERDPAAPSFGGDRFLKDLDGIVAGIVIHEAAATIRIAFDFRRERAEAIEGHLGSAVVDDDDAELLAHATPPFACVRAAAQASMCSTRRRIVCSKVCWRANSSDALAASTSAVRSLSIEAIFSASASGWSRGEAQPTLAVRTRPAKASLS